MMLVLSLSREEAAAAILGFRDGLRLLRMEADDTQHAVTLAHELDAALRQCAASWRGWRIEHPCPICKGTKQVPTFYARCMEPGYTIRMVPCRNCT
jgi:hypothetical protein